MVETAMPSQKPSLFSQPQMAEVSTILAAIFDKSFKRALDFQRRGHSPCTRPIARS